MLSPLDKRILNRLQKDIPFVKRPWRAVAEGLNTKEGLLLKRVSFFKKSGLVRRISAGFNPRKIGFASTLIAVKISPQNLNKAVKKINLYPEVTHNYGRNSEYNLWFTLVARNKKRITQIVNQLKKDKNIEGILELPAIKLFKIDVNLKV